MAKLNAKKPTPGGGKSVETLVRSTNRWRDNFNPLRSLTIAKVVSLIEAAERGDYPEMELTVRRLERRYPVLKGLRSRRISAIERLQWDIKVMEELPAGADETIADAQRQFLRAQYDLITNLPEALGFLELAEFRGFSILQRHDTEDDKIELHWLPQWCFSRDGEFGDWFWNPDSRFGVGSGSCAAVLGESSRVGGPQLDRERFIIREVDAPLYEIALIAFVNWAMGRKDYAAFTEIFGLPNAVVIMPPNIPSGQETNYLSSAEQVADGVSGALPSGSDVKFPTAGVRNNGPFKEFCDAHDADVVLAGTGGLLTMLSMPTGIGQGASDEHGDAFAQIASASARKISAVMQSDFDRVELAKAFPDQPVCVYFDLAAEEKEDVTAVVAQVGGLKSAGYAVSREQVEEKTGYELEEEADPTNNANDANPNRQKPGQDLQDGQDGKPAAPSDDPVKNRANTLTPEKQLASAISADLQPLRDRLARILTIQDGDLLKSKLQAFLAELPQLLTDINADPEIARVIEAIAGPALAKGLTER